MMDGGAAPRSEAEAVRNNMGTRSGGLDPLAPVTVMLMATALEFGGVALYIFGWIGGADGRGVEMLPGGSTHQDVLTALAVAAIYVAAWLGGYYSPRRSQTPKRRWRIAGRPIRLPLLLVLLVGEAVTYIVMYQLHPEHDSTFRSSLTSGGYGRVFFIIIALLIVTIAYASIRIAMLFVSPNIGKQIHGTSGLLTTGGAAFVLSMILLFPLGGRGRAVLPVLLLAAAWHYGVRRITITRVTMVVSLLLALFVVAPLNQARYPDLSLADRAFGFEAFRNFDSLYNLAAVVSAMEDGRVDTSFGSNQICDVVSDIADNAGCRDSREILMEDIYGFDSLEVGFPITKPGELLVSGGIIGVVLGGLAVGWFARRIYDRFALSRRFGHAGPLIYLWLAWEFGAAHPGRYLAQELLPLMVIVPVGFLLIILEGGHIVRRSTEVGSEHAEAKASVTLAADS